MRYQNDEKLLWNEVELKMRSVQESAKTGQGDLKQC
jgi:hypothetical protein